MNFLFDDENLQSVHKNLKGWNEAKDYASEHNLELIGEFVCWIDPDTLEETYLN